MKKLLSLILCCAMILTLFPAISVSAATSTITDITKGWHWPMDSQYRKVTAPFAQDRTNWKNPQYHQGIDIGGAPQGVADIYAARDGIVYETGYSSSMGNYVCIYHGKTPDGLGIYTTYMHMHPKTICVSKNQEVTGGKTKLGKIGNTGASTGTHLHFHISKCDNSDYKPSPKHVTKQQLYDNYIDCSPSNIKYSYPGEPATTTHTCIAYQTKNGKPGVCKVCGKAYNWQNTRKNLSAQVYELKSDYKNSKIGIYKEPYEDAASYSYKVTNKITVVGYVTNAYKNKWYAISYYDSSAKKTVTAYVYAKDFDKKYQKPTASSSSSSKNTSSSSSSKNTSSSKTTTSTQSTAKKPSIDVTSYPTSINQGSSYGLRGTIYANGAKTTVTTEVINKNGKAVLSTTDTVSANSTGDIRYMNANNKITFNTLGAGTYTLKFTAKNSAGTKTWSKEFTVKGKTSSSSTSSSSSKPKSTLTVNLTKYPTSVNKGKSFGLRGSVTSNYNITTVIGTIHDSKGNVVQRTTDYPNSTSMDIRYANVNNNLIFNNLAKGYYVLQVEAIDASGARKIWSGSFNVV